jgi:hypothetical protein
MGPYGAGGAGNMQPPPPAYGAHGQEDYVPAYSPPMGGNKVNPDQNFGQGLPQTGTVREGGDGAGASGQGQAQAQNHPGGDLGQRS